MVCVSLIWSLWMKNLNIRSQNLIMILFLVLINIPALMSIDTTDNEWIILISSFVFSMDMIIIPLLFIFFIIYIGDCLEKLWFLNECWHFIYCIVHTISKGCGCFTFANFHQLVGSYIYSIISLTLFTFVIIKIRYNNRRR